jgi:hypothetical protein
VACIGTALALDVILSLFRICSVRSDRLGIALGTHLAIEGRCTPMKCANSFTNALFAVLRTPSPLDVHLVPVEVCNCAYSETSCVPVIGTAHMISVMRGRPLRSSRAVTDDCGNDVIYCSNHTADIPLHRKKLFRRIMFQMKASLSAEKL